MFKDRFGELLQGTTAYRLAKDTGITNASISRWKKSMEIPSSENLIKLADYFNVSVDYLLGRTSNLMVITSKDDVINSSNDKEQIKMDKYLRFLALPLGKRYEVRRVEEGFLRPHDLAKAIVDNDASVESMQKCIETVERINTYAEALRAIDTGNFSNEDFQALTKFLTDEGFKKDYVDRGNCSYEASEDLLHHYEYCNDKCEEFNDCYDANGCKYILEKGYKYIDKRKEEFRVTELMRVLHEKMVTSYEGFNVESLAKKIGVLPESVHSWLSGERTPNDKCMKSLDDVLKFKDAIRLNEELDRLVSLIPTLRERLKRANESTAEMDEILEIVERIRAI